MIIDDDLTVLQNMAIYLSDSGYIVNTADNGNEAIESFIELKPELVLCDLRMPDIDGLELIELFARQKPEIPIIAISGARQIKDVVEAIRLGAVDYLVKPITDFQGFDQIIKSALADDSKHKLNIEQATSELAEHLKLLKTEDGVEKQLQIQLLPEPHETFGQYYFQHATIPGFALTSNFLDYFEIDENYIGFYTADVSAHGDNAVFASMLLKSLLNLPLRLYRSDRNELIITPGKVLEYLNEELIKSNIGKFISLFYAVIDRKNETLRYSLAGYFPTPVMINGNELVIFDEEGLPVGLFRWAEYQQTTMHIDTSFTLGLFSQGLIDCFGEDKAQTKNQQLAQLLCRRKAVTVSEMMQQLQISTDNCRSSDVSIFLIQRQ